MRIAVIGNSGGGKSVLARKIAPVLGLPCVELDALLWRPGWQLVPPDEFERLHADAIGAERWLIEGLGSRASLPSRFQRATHIVLIDMPTWVHYWLAAERHGEWQTGRLEHPPVGMEQPAPLKALFRTIAEVDRDWLPEIRRLVADESRRGKSIFRLETYEELSSFSSENLALLTPKEG